MTSNYYTVPPTAKQISFADKIAYILNIDFPTCSAEFTKWAYYQFISKHIYEYQRIQAEDPTYYDDEMAWWEPFAEGGY